MRKTLDRYRVSNDLVALGGAVPPEPASFVSFSCYAEAPGDAQRASTPVTLDGHDFRAERIRVPPSPPDATLFIDKYEAVARLLVNGFHYGTFLSEAGLEAATGAGDGGGGGGGTTTTGLESAFASSDFLLTRAYELESIDIYLDPGWLANRPDLLDVYPYARHLKNYVEVFRRQYRRERRRL